MSEKPTEPHDVRTIHQLVRMMKRYDLTALDLIDGDSKIRLRRRGPESAAYVAAPQMAAPLPTTLAAPAATAPLPAPAAKAANEIVIESPMVGTYYSSPAPDLPPFVNPGATVRPDTTVCVIEAMKVFTDIPAGVSGTITEVLVKSGQPVEFGQPLFRLQAS